MAQLTVTALDDGGAPAEGVLVTATLTDLNGHVLREFSSGGLLVQSVKEITGEDGTCVLEIVPNSEIARDNTYYTIRVGARKPLLIEKGVASETLSAATVVTAEELGIGARLDDLADVTLAGVGNGNSLRYVNGEWIPAPWPAGGGVGDKSWVTLNSSASLTVADSVSRHLADASGVPIIVTLPSAAGLMPTEFTIKRVNSGSNNVTVTSISGIDGTTNYLLDMQWESVTVSSNNSQWMVI